VILKGKFHPRTNHEGPEREKNYIYALSLILALEGEGDQRRAPAALLPVRNLVNIV